MDRGVHRDGGAIDESDRCAVGVFSASSTSHHVGLGLSPGPDLLFAPVHKLFESVVYRGEIAARVRS